MGKSLALTKRIVSFFMLTAVVAVGIISVRAQSQAINGQIEGIVSDSAGASVAGATVTVRNIESGSERTMSTLSLIHI